MDDEKVLITESTLDEIADAIREKNGESFKYYPREMPSAVRRIPTGTGGGSVVAVFPILHDGEHIADIVVDGETFEIYAPDQIEYEAGAGIEITGDTIAVSQALRNTISGKVDSDTLTTIVTNLTAAIADKQDILTAGQNITIVGNVISATGGGASAVSDLTDVNLNDLADGQVLKWNATSQKWENANESGGTTVIANPTGTPTEELSTIQIGEDIYEIVGGGGGGGNGYEEYTLYSDDNAPASGEITLSDDVNNYDILVFKARYTGSGNLIDWSASYPAKKFATEFPYVASATYANARHLCIQNNNTSYVRVIMGSANNKLYTFSNGTGKIVEVLGLKFGSGGGTGGGSSTEVVSIAAGDGTSTRTFTFTKKPKFVHIWYTVPDKWSMTEDIFWGQPWGVYDCTNGNAPYGGGAQGSNTIAFDDVNLTMTITGINALGCANNTNGYGWMLIDYGEGGGGSPLPFNVVIDPNDNGINLIYEYDDGQ